MPMGDATALRAKELRVLSDELIRIAGQLAAIAESMNGLAVDGYGMDATERSLTQLRAFAERAFKAVQKENVKRALASDSADAASDSIGLRETKRTQPSRKKTPQGKKK